MIPDVGSTVLCQYLVLPLLSNTLIFCPALWPLTLANNLPTWHQEAVDVAGTWLHCRPIRFCPWPTHDVIPGRLAARAISYRIQLTSQILVKQPMSYKCTCSVSIAVLRWIVIHIYYWKIKVGKILRRQFVSCSAESKNLPFNNTNGEAR